MDISCRLALKFHSLFGIPCRFSLPVYIALPLSCLSRALVWLLPGDSSPNTGHRCAPECSIWDSGCIKTSAPDQQSTTAELILQLELIAITDPGIVWISCAQGAVLCIPLVIYLPDTLCRSSCVEKNRPPGMRVRGWHCNVHGAKP